jgi:hypothetical protein
MSKEILVFGEKTFKITVPDGARITFGPWSPPSKEARYEPQPRNGTLRVYEGAKSTENIIAVFSGVQGFRDLSLGYAEVVAREEGSIIWKDDKEGYMREEKVKRSEDWIMPTTPELTNGAAHDEDEAATQ